MSFYIVAGIRPNSAPQVGSKLSDQTAYRKQLFYYKFPSDTFTDADGDTLYFIISKPNGDYIPNWLSYEDITKTLSGIANENATGSLEVLVIADDRRGGSASQTFTIYLDSIYSTEQNYLALIIVVLLLAAFIVIVTLIVCRKNLKCGKKKKNQEPDSDDDSYEEDDDICIEDAKPKNPFQFKKQIDQTPDDKFKNDRFKFYGSKG